MKVAEARPAERKTDRKVRVPKNARLVRFFMHPAGKTLLIVFAGLMVTGAIVFTRYYLRYAKLIDEKLRGGPYITTSRIYAAPSSIAIGDETSPSDIAAALRRSGYTENRKNPVGTYTIRPESIE